MSIHFKRRNLTVWAAGLTLAAVFCLQAPMPARAVTVGPTKLQLAVDPGQSVSGNLFVKNEDAETRTFYPSIQRFSVNPDGQKVFYDDPASIASWFDLPGSVTLAPGEDRQVPFTLTAPADAPPGGHFGVIWWGTSPPGGEQVAIVTRAGILTYLRVSGNIIEEGRIDSFGGDSRFAWGLPARFSVHFNNSGNVALSPKGDIRISNIFGVSKAVLPVNPYGAIILPGSSESFSVPWQGEGFFFGIYKAALNLEYGESGLSDQADWWFVMMSPLAMAVLVLVILLAFVAPPLLRRYNHWIIERAKQE